MMQTSVFKLKKQLIHLHAVLYKKWTCFSMSIFSVTQALYCLPHVIITNAIINVIGPIDHILDELGDVAYLLQQELVIL